MNLRKTLITVGVYLVIAGVFSSFFAIPTAQAAPNQFTFNPVADAYVSADAPDKNFGANQSLRVDGSPVLRSYLRFDVTGLEGQVSSARLRILANSASRSGVNISTVSDTSWDENAITWNNAPQIDGTGQESNPVIAGEWISVDVTSAIQGNGLVSLAVATSGETAINLAAREEGSRSAPQLVISTSKGTTPSLTPTTPTATVTIPPTSTPPSTPTPTIAPTQPTPTPPPPTGEDAVLVGAGDISVCGSSGDDQTAALLQGISGTVFTAGDNVYDSGTTSQFNNCFNPSWGQVKDRMRPSAGNHDYQTSGASGYYGYFGAAAGPAGLGYYSYNLGSWHIIVLNSNCSAVGGCGTGSAQETWLRADLAANPSQCTAAYWHHPRFSSGSEHGNSTAVQPLWQALYDSGAEVVISGHDHHYERFAPQTPSGSLDALNGIREFVVGTGGAGLYNLGSTKPNSEVRNSSTHGVLKLTLRSGSYSWNFVPVAGKTFTDSGSDVCH